MRDSQLPQKGGQHTQLSPLEWLPGIERRGWNWIRENAERFWPEQIEKAENIKAIAELSMLYGRLWEWGEPGLADIAGILHRYLENPSAIQCGRKVLGRFDAYLPVYLVMRRTGYRSADYERAVRELRESGYPATVEAVPYRELERQYLWWKAGLRREPAWRRGYRATTLARCRNPVYLTEEDVYAVTHTLFYLTDFGGVAPPLPEEEQHRIGGILETMLVHYCRQGHWDLAGELLINLISLNTRGSTTVVATAAEALRQAWTPNGALPGVTPQCGGSQGTADEFSLCYHTTLVGLLFCACWRHRVTTRNET